jgi:xanthine dehydrogenase YagR molybdenum-binding subunit
MPRAASSSRSTRECYRAAAERFGWMRRNPRPRSMRDGRWLIGWGMATATYPMNYAPATAMARLLPDGTAEVMSASSDMGPGTWTSMTQVAAEALGLPIERVKFTLGDLIGIEGDRAAKTRPPSVEIWHQRLA